MIRLIVISIILLGTLFSSEANAGEIVYAQFGKGIFALANISETTRVTIAADNHCNAYSVIVWMEYQEGIGGKFDIKVERKLIAGISPAPMIDLKQSSFEALIQAMVRKICLAAQNEMSLDGQEENIRMVLGLVCQLIGMEMA